MSHKKQHKVILQTQKQKISNSTSSKSFKDSSYTVINEVLIRKCIRLKKPDKDEEDKKLQSVEIKREQMEFKEVDWLEFSFQNIHTISNLEGFDNLLVLQLDNNNITEICGVNHLKKLQRLDLSFNKIKKIENLDGLLNLNDLSLYDNEIEDVGGLDDLTNLVSLSIAKNNIKDMSFVRYLRKFKKLGMLTVHDNPVCLERTFRAMVLAFLKNLQFLDYRLVHESEREPARGKFHDELSKLNKTEQEQEQQEELEEEESKKHEEMDRANMLGVDDLLQSMTKNDPEAKNMVVFDYILIECKEKYKSKFQEIVGEFKAKMFDHLKKKTDEIEEIDSCLNESVYKNDGKSKEILKKFERMKKQIFHDIQEEANEEKIIKIFDEMINEKDKVYNELLEIEINQSDAFSYVIDSFCTNFQELDASETIREFVKKLRELEAKYIEEDVRVKLFAEADGLEQKTQDIPEKAKLFLEDKDQLESMIARSTEARFDTISEIADSLLATEKKRMEEVKERVKLNEHSRNRSRIAEIWTIMDRAREEINLERSKYH